MKSFRITVQTSLISFLLLTLVGCSSLGSTQSGAIQASGVIEATEIAVSPIQSGTVLQVMVKEGELVKTGDELMRLDDSLLQAQRKVAAAGLDSAQGAVQSAQASLDSATAQYQMTLDTALATDQGSRILDWKEPVSDTIQQPAWYFTQAERVAAAQAALDTAQTALDDSKSNLEKVIQNLNNANFLAAEKRLADARMAYNVAQDVNNRAQAMDQALVDAAKKTYDDAKDELDRAQEAYDKMLTTQAAKDVLKARAELSVAQERYSTSQDQLRALQTGELAPQVVAAQKVVQEAKDGLQQAQSGVAQAQAQMGLIDAQIKQLSVYAPIDGVVLTRSIEPGEVIQAGTTALTIGKLDNLKVTVYISEDRYGQISLGDHANLSVDSFPNETFDAVVTHIANQAEYTPQNVQTKEERQTTVYAVELSITNPQGKLIPGMPTDVEFVK
jgi:HlyD family secretion protein